MGTAREIMRACALRFALAAALLSLALAVDMEEIGPVTIDLPTDTADKAVADAEVTGAKSDSKGAMAKIEAVEQKMETEAKGDDDTAGDAAKLVLATDSDSKPSAKSHHTHSTERLSTS